MFIEDGSLDRHIRRTATRYAARRHRLLTAVTRHLPGWHVTGVAAGLHAVLVPSSSPTLATLQEAADAAGPLGVVPLHAFALGSQSRPGLVVGYAAVAPDQIERGIAAMAVRLR